MLKFFASVIISFSLPFYWVTEMLFRIFFVLAEGQLVSPDRYQVLISNFYVILGVVLLFILSFSMLKSMVNPEEKKGTESTKKIIMNLITSAVIMVLLPTIFTFAFDLQTSIIGSEYNVIGKIFGFGASNTEVQGSENSNVKQAAATVTNSIFTAFFNVDPNACENEVNSQEDLEVCQGEVYSNDGETSFAQMVDEVDENGKLRMYTQFSEAWTDGKIEFNILLSIICGIILVYVVASFCIDMAIRLVKLVFYQLIAPVPLFFRVVPDTKLSGTFNQWVKVTLATYFEVYIRIIIVYFVLFLCIQITDSGFLETSFSGLGVMAGLIAKALIFIGLITFMRQAPKLISEITGIDTGNMKLGIREKLAAGGLFTAGAIIGGAGTALVNNATNGFKNIKNKWGETKGAGGKAGLIAGALGSTVAGAASGAVRSGKAGLGAKSFGDMKSSASSGAKGAIGARDKRTQYKANHEGRFGVIKGHAEDALRGMGEWAGIGVVSSAEADYFTSGANAFDAGHSQLESIFKGKPGHNKLKEKVTELDVTYNRLLKEAGFNKADLDLFIEHAEGKKSWGEFTDEQQRIIEKIYDSKDKAMLISAKKEIDAAKAEQKIHEAAEMSKKMSVSMESFNAMVNAKIKYFDLADAIFTDDMYNLLKDASGKNQSQSEAIRNIVNKIQNNEQILMTDLRDTNGNDLIDLNSLEEFLDKVGIKAKDLATEKRVEVAHKNALKEEKKSDGK